MKRFGSWTATDAQHQTLNGSLLSFVDADVSVQRRSQSNHRIPIVFLSVYATAEEQRVPIRFAAFQFPPRPLSKKRVPGRGRSSARISLQLTWNK